MSAGSVVAAEAEADAVAAHVGDDARRARRSRWSAAARGVSKVRKWPRRAILERRHEAAPRKGREAALAHRPRRKCSCSASTCAWIASTVSPRLSIQANTARWR